MLCGKRYLSGEHVGWIIKQLKIQAKYKDHVFLFKSSAQHQRNVRTNKKLGKFQTPDNISIVINVGRGNDGRTYLGSDSRESLGLLLRT